MECAHTAVVMIMPAWLGRWRRARAPAASYVTWRVAPGQPPLQPRERDVVFEAVLVGNGSRHELAALVVMDDHVHVLVRAAPDAACQLVRSWQASSSHQLQRIHRRPAGVWAETTAVTPVDGDERIRAIADCILGNPWKRWPFLKGYRWVYHRIGIEN